MALLKFLFSETCPEKAWKEWKKTVQWQLLGEELPIGDAVGKGRRRMFLSILSQAFLFAGGAGNCR